MSQMAAKSVAIDLQRPGFSLDGVTFGPQFKIPNVSIGFMRIPACFATPCCLTLYVNLYTCSEMFVCVCVPCEVLTHGSY